MAPTYRTKKSAGAVSEPPKNMAIITTAKYQNALSLYQNKTAYLQPISKMENLKFTNGKMILHGLPVTSTQLQELYITPSMISIDLPLLRALYTIILSDFEKCKRKNIPITHTLYLPDFLSWLSGGDKRINRLMIDTYTNKILDFQRILGIINGQPLPLMGEVKIDIFKNTLCFSSPYMNALVQKVYTSSIRKDKKTGEPKLSSSGQPLLKPSHSYLVKPSITKERNKKAVEIVTMIVVLIEQAGNRTAHIRASTIIERCPELQSALVKASTSNKNLLLRRTFSKVWELLKTQTILTLTYKNIHLPNEKSTSWIPTTKSLDMVFTFPHEGKIKSASTQENII